MVNVTRDGGPDYARWMLAGILVFGFILRTWNLDWDRGTHLHPDERFWSDVAANVHNPDSWNLSEVLDPEKSSLNPRVYKDNYVYGTMPLWASEAVAGILMTDTMSWAVSGIDSVGIDVARDEPADAPIRERLRFNTGYDVTIIGRLVSALVDTATIGAVYFLARELTGDRRVGLLGALLQACTVLHIQYSHFLGSEPWVAFFVTCAVLGGVRLARGRGSWRTRTATAVAVGLAVASKLSGIASVAAPFAAALVLAGPELVALVRTGATGGSVARLARRLEPFVLMALIAVIAYRVAQPYEFRAGLSLVFNDRFERDLEYLSDINQGGNWPWVQPLVGAAPVLHPVKQMLLWGMGPGLGLAAVVGCGHAVRRFLRGERFWSVPLAVVAAYLVLVSTQFYAIIRYLQPTYPILTALAAASLLAAWDWARARHGQRSSTAVRVAVGLSIGATVFWALAFVNGVYGQDNARIAAGDWMLANLEPGTVVSQQEWDDGLPWHRPSQFEHVVLKPFSFGGDSPEHIEQLIAGLVQVDYVIESSNKFYDALPRTPARYPQTTRYYETLFDGSLGFELVAEFQNQPSLFGITIDDSGAEEAFTLYDHPTVLIWKKTDRFSVERAYELLNPDRARVAINAIPRDAFANGGMLRPDEYRTQQTHSSFADVHSSDAGSVAAALQWFVLVQVISFAVAPVLVTSAGRAGGAVYGLSKPLAVLGLALPIWLLVAFGVVNMSKSLIVAVLLVEVAAAGWFARRRLAHLRSAWQTHRRTILAAEAVFVGAFLVVLALRATNPDLWHPWRGGEKPMELAYLTAVTGSTTLPPYDPWLAGGSLNYYYVGWFVLAVPIRLLGLDPTVGFNLGVATYAALAAVTVFSTAAMLAELARRGGARLLSPARTGLLGVLFFLVIGNLDGFRQVVMRLREGLPLSQFDWWDPSRVNKNSPGFEVTEFPSFTVLFADLHPHFMAMPFFGLGLAGCIAIVERIRQGRNAWALAFGLGLGSGWMRMVHTWDLPAFVLLVGGAITFGWIIARGPTLWRLSSWFGQLTLAGVAHLLVTAPYRARNQVADSGFHRAESSTNLDDFVAHWGLFLFIGAAYIGSELWARREQWAKYATLSNATSMAGALTAAFGFFAFHFAVGSVAAWAFVGVVAAGLLLMTELGARRASTARIVVAACWLLGFAVLVGVETFTQNADIQRLNTVFKFWLQVWHLFAIAAAFGASKLLAGPRGHPAHRGFAVGLVALVVASLLYPVLSVGPRQANRIDTALGPSLDGHLWLTPGEMILGVRDAQGIDREVDPGEDRAIIDWLQTNAEGRPTIVEAVGGGEYQWWGRISIRTGLPTVVGWRWHQEQQRTLFGFEVNERTADVVEFYGARDQDTIDRFLRAYDVTYVIVGSLELAAADPAMLALLADNPHLTVVFEDGPRRIYGVDKASLAQASGASSVSSG